MSDTDSTGILRSDSQSVELRQNRSLFCSFSWQGSDYVAQVGLKLIIFPSVSPESLDYRCVYLHAQANSYSLSDSVCCIFVIAASVYIHTLYGNNYLPISSLPLTNGFCLYCFAYLDTSYEWNDIPVTQGCWLLLLSITFFEVYLYSNGSQYSIPFYGWIISNCTSMSIHCEHTMVCVPVEFRSFLPFSLCKQCYFKHACLNSFFWLIWV